MRSNRASKWWGTGPDKGYSWIVVLASAYVYFVGMGFFRTSGVLFLAYIREFGATRGGAAWPLTICSAVLQLTSPLSGFLIQYLSFRKTCFLGTAIATIGVASCYFATNMLWVNIFYGGVQGVGVGILLTLVPVRINQYFVRHRVTAMGLAISGASISTFFLPSLLEALLEAYGLQGTFLMCGGLVLNVMVSCALLKDPEWLNKQPTVQKQQLLIKNDNSEGVLHAVEISPSVKQYNHIDNNNPKSDSIAYSDDEEEQYKLMTDLLQTKIVSSEKYGTNKPIDQKGKMKANGAISEPQDNHKPIACSNGNYMVLVMRNPMFYAIAITFSFLFLVMNAWFTVILDFAKDKGIPQSQSIHVLTVTSITDIIGRIGLGWVTDRRYLTKGQMVIINFTILSLLQMLYPLITSLVELCVLAAIQGLAIGAVLPLFIELQVEYIGPERLPLVLGMANFINGVLAFAPPPIIGLFRDKIGSYTWMFYFLGMVCFLVASIWIAEWYISWRTRKRKYIANAN